MATFVKGYIEPGVYVESEIKPTLVIGTVGNFVPVLIGTMDTHKKVVSDNLTYNTDSTLVKVSGQNILFSDVRTDGSYAIDNFGYVYYEGSDKDFVLSADDDNYLQITWNTGKKPAGTSYKLYFYLKKSVEDYEPKFFYSTQTTEAFDFLGKVEVDNNGNVKYSLPLGFSLAIANGASGVWCISLYDSQGNKRLTEILDKLQTLKNPDGSYPYSIVVLGGYMYGQASGVNDLTFDEVSSVINHVRTMSSVENQQERIAIFGPPKDAVENIDNYKNTIAQLKDRRVVYCYPARVKVNVGTVTVTVGGYYLAAAIAGLIDSLAMNMPLTGQLVSGFSEISDNMIREQKNVIAASGCLIVEDSMRIRHALTTDQTNMITGELKVTRIVDYVMRLMRSSLVAFVNQPYTSGLLSTIAISVKLLLTQLANINVITDYRDINVVRNGIDPRQVDVSFAIRPSFDINWIYVKFTVEV
jgi:hypothetical protein